MQMDKPVDGQRKRQIGKLSDKWTVKQRDEQVTSHSEKKEVRPRE